MFAFPFLLVVFLVLVARLSQPFWVILAIIFAVAFLLNVYPHWRYISMRMTFSYVAFKRFRKRYSDVNADNGLALCLCPLRPTGRTKTHWWVPVDTHGTPVPYKGRPWVARVILQVMLDSFCHILAAHMMVMLLGLSRLN